jgi:hypothetical protein
MFAATAVVMLFAAPGCAVGRADNPEYVEIIRVVDAVMGDLRVGNYADVRGLLCQGYSVDTLRQEFDRVRQAVAVQGHWF